MAKLFDFDLGASSLDLFLDLFSLFLGNTLLEGLRGALDESFRLGQTETRDGRADFLVDCNLVRPSFLLDNVKGCLLFGGGSRRASGGRSGSSDGHGCRGTDAPFLFELLHQVGDLKDSEGAELID